jgi:7-cyano-7-deazaguanine synthase
MSIVTLTSGGIDSTLMSLIAHEDGIIIAPLFLDYGQLGMVREWAACRFLHKKYGLPKVTRMDLSGYGKVVPSGITNIAMRINEDAFLPGRNLLFLLCGAAYAYRINADGVAIGLLTPEYHLFPDHTLEFLRMAEDTIETAMGRHLAVLTPLIEFTKSDILSMAAARGLHDTYSCHAGGPEPCGKCVACIEIAKAKERS